MLPPHGASVIEAGGRGSDGTTHQVGQHVLVLQTVGEHERERRLDAVELVT